MSWACVRVVEKIKPNNEHKDSKEDNTDKIEDTLDRVECSAQPSHS